MRALCRPSSTSCAISAPQSSLTRWPARQTLDRRQSHRATIIAVEKVTINKDGDDYDAQRDGDPPVYVLDAKTMDDLQKAISGIKPYQAPKTDRRSDRLNGLLTDLYELTMAAGYFAAGKTARDRQLSSSPSAACRATATSCSSRACTAPSNIC